jgi:hypothetical protein
VANEKDALGPIDADFDSVLLDRVVGIKEMSAEEIEKLPFAKWGED